MTCVSRYDHPLKESAHTTGWGRLTPSRVSRYDHPLKESAHTMGEGAAK
jgi:hypothetical protein